MAARATAHLEAERALLLTDLIAAEMVDLLELSYETPASRSPRRFGRYSRSNRWSASILSREIIGVQCGGTGSLAGRFRCSKLAGATRQYVMMTNAASVVAVVSAAVAFGSLVWQVNLYRLSGARIRLDIAPGLMTHRGTVVTWSRPRDWPTPPENARIDEQDMWVELVRLRVANLGRTVLWVGDLGLDFGRASVRHSRSRTTVMRRPVAVAGGVQDNEPIRLEPGQSASMFLPIADVVRWASKQVGKSQLTVHAAATFGGIRTRRSPRLRSWRVGPDSVTYPHAAVTKHTRLYRVLLDAWPSSDISGLYEACIDVMVAHDDPSRGSLVDVLEPYIPNLMARIQLATRLDVEFAAGANG